MDKRLILLILALLTAVMVYWTWDTAANGWRVVERQPTIEETTNE